MMQQSIDQRSPTARIVAGPGPGVDHHACGLIDDGEFIIFIDNIESDGFGDGTYGWSLGGAENRDLFASSKLEGGFDRRVIEENLLSPN